MIPTLIDHLWQSTLVAGFAALLVLLLRRNAASVRYWVWFAASVKFLVPFSVLVTLGATVGTSLGKPGARAPSVAGDWAVLVERVAEPMASLTSPSAAATPVAEPLRDGGFDVAEVAVGIWLLGVIVVLGIWLVRWWRLAGMVRRARPLRVEHVDRIVASVPMVAVSASVEPGVFGIFRPVLVVPHGMVGLLTGAQLQAVVAHEMCHVRRRDNLTAAVHMLVEALFWFYPFVWWIGARLLDERERACDEAVLASGIEPDAYAEGIIEVCRYYVGSPLPCAAGVGGGRSLKARVEQIMMHDASRSLGVARKTVLSGVAGAVLGVPIVIGLIQPERADAQLPGNGPAFSSFSIEAGDVTADSNAPGSLLVDAGGRLTVTNMPLRKLVSFAYGLDEVLVAVPTDPGSRRYTIRATATPRSGFGSLDDYRAMMRSLLADRFALELHREARRMPVLELIASSDAAALLSAQPGNPPYAPSPSIRFQPGSITVNGALELLRGWLSMRLARPVIDRTGLTGSYSFTLVWGSSAEWDVTSLSAPRLEQLAPALEAQLGLSLVATEDTVEMLVVDRVVPPENLRPARRAINLDTAILDRYVGHYGIAEIGWIVRVDREEGRLIVRVNADRPFVVLPRSETEFFAETTDAEIELIVEQEEVQALVVRARDLATSPMWGRPLDAATAEPMLAEIEARYASQAPQPGADEIVRRIARVLAGEETLPVDGGDDFDPARAIRDALERDRPDAFAARGNLVSIDFDSVNTMGQDVYRVVFERLAFDIVLGLNAAGTVASLVYRTDEAEAA